MTHKDTPMTIPIILASASEIRAEMLRNAGVRFDVIRARIDEEAIKAALFAESAKPRDVADTLAEMKARKVAERHPQSFVIGSDQVLEFDGNLLSKPASIDEARAQLATLNGKTHRLMSAAVVYHEGEPVWRHVGVVRMHMREASQDYLDDYLARNFEDIRHCVGCYQLEHEGIRLFRRIEGDYFHVLGMPLVELLGFLTLREAIAG